MHSILCKCALTILLLGITLEAKNPIYSPTFDDLIHNTLHGATYSYDDTNITISVPKFADNPSQVPVSIDASKIKEAKRMIVFADLNYIPEIMDVKLLKLDPIFSFNIRVAQETPVRVLVEDANGLWHVGSANIKSSGGGCATPNTPEESKKFALLQGKHKSSVTRVKDTYFINFSIFHPMETGLMFGTTAFYIKHLDLYYKQELIGSMELTSAISQNPTLLLQTSAGDGTYSIDLEDTDANEYRILTKLHAE
ncbi:thiosulfate oxidation carrier protein SoxY [Sulfuricurvum sp.]|uniref:thiosulfate oxidation carrier protein SoxY n=1 Tax=Sulfuricurvum sp. TaxID=2025608 RepID=UPI003BB00122